MANKQGKYSAFKDWLLWCRQEGSRSAISAASYLRQLENKLLVCKLGSEGELHRIHEALNEIDSGTLSNITLSEVIDWLKHINETISKARTEFSIEFSTLQGFQRAFNLYLKFLADVTDCFDMTAVMKINPKIDSGGPSDKKIDVGTTEYKNRLKIFKAGIYKPLLKLLDLSNIIDKRLDEFSEAVDNLIASKGRMVVPTQFIMENDDDIALGNWRGTIIDNIRVDYDLIYNNRPKQIPYKVVRLASVTRTAEILSEMLYYTLLLQHNLSQYTDPESNVVVDRKEIINTLKSAEQMKRDITDLERNVRLIKDLLIDYARCFEVKALM